MDQVRDLNTFKELISYIDQAKESLSPDFVLIILGPTASGKTKLAVQVAKALNGEIISADSRQVYKYLDIGTGKDLIEYQDIPYHLIDIREPDELYQVDQFKEDVQSKLEEIRRREKLPIICGGTGSYIESLLLEKPLSAVPKHKKLQEDLARKSKEALIQEIKEIGVPEGMSIDWNNHKRLVRALEIVRFLQFNPLPKAHECIVRNYLIVGLNPSLAQRRLRIDLRLQNRMAQGLLQEVEDLLARGVLHEQLQWFGLEYKYASSHILGELTVDEFLTKLRTEIHRFAKRQMTYFRKMEKEGLYIHWLNS
ncbi:tRNA (adenosine(37)-N6)-dimethylallyltransferase MiaA [Sphingobacterium sp. HJSM2_6]|uniref:tRNA (adenosine(37)-N6)-dimethylallyltransferase MiaA n=1 Tax=Sphingobacterium sp. HJSM2_6 TaxID=3366264 RepID=UPI003BCF6617